MKKVYIILVLLVLVGVGAGYLLVPREREVALINYKEQVYDFNKDAYKSKDTYMRRFAEGDHSVDVVNALVDIYLQEGNVNDATLVLETFIKEKPDNIPARKQLGTLYQYAQRPSDYLKNLEEIKALSGNKEVLRDLSDIYSFNEDYGKQKKIMNEMIASKQPLEPRQFIELANIQAASGQPMDAIATLNSLKAAHPEGVNYDSVRLLVGLLLDQGEKDKALAEVVAWKPKSTDINELQQLANMLHYKGDAALAEKFLNEYGDSLFEHPELASEKVLVLVDQGKDREAFDALNRLNAAGTLPKDMIDSYLLLALRYGDEKLIADLTAKITPELVEEPQAISLTELAVSSHRPALLSAIHTQLGTDEYRQAHPLFSLVLGLAVNEPETDKKVTAFLDETVTTDPQRVMLARACAMAEKLPCTERLIAELKKGTMDESRVIAVGNLYLDIHKYADGLAFIEQNRGEKPSAEVQKVWVKLAAANGRDDEVVNWLSANEANQSEELLTDIYFLAGENKHKSLALSSALLLNHLSNTSTTRNYLAHAYLDNGRFKDALALLKENNELTDELVDSYLAALIAQAKQDPSYRDDLAEFASEQLASGKMSGKRKMALVYALIDSGNVGIAMPYIREFALSSGGDWAAIYAENLNKMGRYEEAREFWLMAAQRPGIRAEEKRSIAFALLEHGYREDALGLFMELAVNAKPDSADVQQLVYLWGPRLEQKQLEWLYGRATAAQDPLERGAWMKLVMDSASADGVVGLASSYPDALHEPEILDAYLLAQYDMKNHDALDEMMGNIREGRYSPDIIRHYARFSRDYAMPKRAEEAYEELLKVQPDDEEALREVGVMTYSAADYSQAKDYLGNYLVGRKTATTKDKDAYLAYFYYAEMLRRDKQDKEAAKYYQATIDTVMKEPEMERSSDMESKLYQSQVWLGNADGGFKGFQDAVKRYPNDDVLRADMVSTLVDAKHYKEARAELRLPTPVMGDVADGQALEISHLEFASYKLLGNRRELLLAYDPIKNPKPSVSESAPLTYGWMGYVSQGYNQVLVAARPDYTLEVVQRQNGDVSVVAHKDEAMSSRRLEAQSKLRYELLKSRIDLETGEQYTASKRLNQMLPDYPNDSQLLGYTANAENFVGRWSHALKLLRQAHALAPENEDIEILKRDIEKQHAEHIKLDHEWLAQGKSDEQITTLSGFATVSDGMDVGAVIQNNNISSASVRRADGQIGEFNKNKQRGEVFVRHVDDEGTMLKGSLFANNDSLGLGGYVDFVNRFGVSGLAAEIHRPYWDFVEGVLDDATRDRVELHHAARIDQHITVDADASLNRYNVKDAENVASSAGVSASVGYQVLEDPNVSLVYGLDAEYELDHSEKLDATGESYRPFPFRTREVHSLAVAGDYHFNRETYLDYVAGYGVDRFGGSGPIGELRLTHEITDDLEVQARAAYGLSVGETDANVSRVGAYLLYRY